MSAIDRYFPIINKIQLARVVPWRVQAAQTNIPLQQPSGRTRGCQLGVFVVIFYFCLSHPGCTRIF